MTGFLADEQRAALAPHALPDATVQDVIDWVRVRGGRHAAVALLLNVDAALAQNRDELDHLRSAVARVRRLHYPYRSGLVGYDTCPGCTVGMGPTPWPCPTELARLGE